MQSKPLSSSGCSATLGLTMRWILSLFVTFHVLAVIAEPFRFFSQSPAKRASAEAGWLRSTLGPYVDFMYLSHGYSFFAPNPGPSHLLESELTPKAKQSDLRTQSLVDRKTTDNKMADLRWRVFPDRNIDRPRLLYHRYFMLSEFFHALAVPATVPEAEFENAGQKENWLVERSLFEALQDSIIERLSTQYQSDRVKLRRIEHGLPSEQDILGNGWSLTDPRLYVELSDGAARK